VLELDAASRTSVEDVRDLIESARFQPAISRFRVFILDEAHMLSRSAFNALLKTLEEPPAFVVFILATTEPQKLPPTVLSRCQRFDFARLNTNDFEALIRKVAQSEGLVVDDDRFIPLLYQYSGGAARDGLSLLEQVALYSGNTLSQKGLAEILGIPETQLVIRLLDALVSNDANEVLECAAKGYSSGGSFWTFLNVWAGVVRDALALKAGLAPALLYADDDRRRLEAVAARATAPMLIDALEKQGDYRFTYKWESEGQLLWDMVFVSLLADFHEVRSGRGRTVPGRRPTEPLTIAEPLPVGPDDDAKQVATGPKREGALKDAEPAPAGPSEPPREAGPAKRTPEPSPARMVSPGSLLFANPPPIKKRTKGADEGASEERSDEPQGRRLEGHTSRGSATARTEESAHGIGAGSVATLEAVEVGEPVKTATPDADCRLPDAAEPGESLTVVREGSTESLPVFVPTEVELTSADMPKPAATALPDEWAAFLEWLEERDLALTIFLAQADSVEMSEERVHLEFPPEAIHGYMELRPPHRRKRVKEMLADFSRRSYEDVELLYREADGEKWRNEMLALVNSVFPGAEVQDS
jgi:DNA polymerase III subunit gamma/tau